MPLKDRYERFLKTPESDLLASNAALHYITTTTTFTGAGEITKHLIKQRNSINKKGENIINAIEGPNSLSLEIETCLEFTTGGGAYLLDLDDNFIVDRTVTFTQIHIVQFDDDKKISQIRLYWDQGSLLKQVDVIGSHHRNWPIRDGLEQTRLIHSSVSAARECARDIVQADNISISNPTSVTARSSKSKPGLYSSTHLSLFDSQDDLLPQVQKTSERLHESPLEGKPKPRAFDSNPEHQFGVDSALTPKPSSKTFNHFEFGEAEAPLSSTKRPQGHKHFEFGEAKVPIPPTQLKPCKAQGHFEFGDAPLAGAKPDMAIRPRSSKHESQWDFVDFVTPEKPRRKVRGQDVRHFAWSDDDCEPQETPQRKPRVIHPRRDAAAHFEFEDDEIETAAQVPPRKTTGMTHNKGLKLYENNLYSEASDTEEDKAPNQPSTNVSTNVNRRKDFDSHWDMFDEPLTDTKARTDQSQQTGANHIKAVKMMGSSWDMYERDVDDKDGSVAPVCAKRSSRNVNQPSWGFGDESPC